VAGTSVAGHDGCIGQDGGMDDAIDLVSRFCAAWPTSTASELAAWFTDDAVYHNIPIDPVTGKEAIEATIAGFSSLADHLEFEVLNIAGNGNVVLTERIDHFHRAAGVIDLPVMGTFEVRDGKIAAWRDYFDLNQFMTQFAG
jgi:limonene-1,2-epoxide hydrolase